MDNKIVVTSKIMNARLKRNYTVIHEQMQIYMCVCVLLINNQNLQSKSLNMYHHHCH